MNQVYRCVLIEDEPLAMARFEKLLARTGFPAVVTARLENLQQARAWFSGNPAPDLIFSDIQLGDGTSFSIFESFPDLGPIIFTTSYDEYALRAFRHFSIDYLLKPVKEAELKSALQKFESVLRRDPESGVFRERMEALIRSLDLRKASRYRERFLVKKGDQLIPVAIQEIAYFHTRNDWVCLTTHDNRQFFVDFRLDELEDSLDPALFFRVNRQVLASPSAMQKARQHLNGKLKLELVPAPDGEIFVSREKAAAFRTWWESAG